MYLLSQAKNGISALGLGRQIGVSASTAWLVRRRLIQVMPEREAGRKPEGEVQVDDACLGGKRPGGQPVVLKPSPAEAFRKDAVEEWAGESVEPGKGECRRAGLLHGLRGGRLRARAAGGGGRAGQLRQARAGLGQHGPGACEALLGRNVPPAGSEVRGPLSGGVPVALQPALRPGGAAAAADAGGGYDPAAAAPGAGTARVRLLGSRPQRRPAGTAADRAPGAPP